MSTDKAWYVYLVKTQLNEFYTGVSTDVDNRIKVHNAGKGSKMLRGSRLPVKLLVKIGPFKKADAHRIEVRVKRLPKRRKYSAMRDLI